MAGQPTASVCGSSKRGGASLKTIVGERAGKGGRRRDPGLLVLDASRLKAEVNF